MSRKKDCRSKAAEEKFAEVFQSWLEQKNMEAKVMEEKRWRICLASDDVFFYRGEEKKKSVSRE